jgi:small-conductance mechanosensitive channel
MRNPIDTKSHSWREVGLARQLSAKAVKRARIEFFVLFPMLAATLLVYGYRTQIFGRALGPSLFRRLDPGTAGTVGFLLRLVTIIVALLVALRVAGLAPQTLALGGALTAVVLGLAAQQTLGNLFAGTVLLSARPFRVGERVQLQGGGIGIEGVVSSLGLLYTTFDSGDDTIMVPNSVVLGVAITPLREPEGVDLRARLRAGMTPLDVQELLRNVETPVRGVPSVVLEELDGDEIIVRIAATPERASDGPRLASEVLAAVAPETRRDAA